jgi:fructose-1,6-bisphosphatase/inositol monophosphatase family enzyme
MSGITTSKFVKLHELLNTCVLLSKTAGNTVRNVQKSGTLNVFQKGICQKDVCTEADLRIQKTIQHNLKQLYPGARVICEEDD